MSVIIETPPLYEDIVSDCNLYLPDYSRFACELCGTLEESPFDKENICIDCFENIEDGEYDTGDEKEYNLFLYKGTEYYLDNDTDEIMNEDGCVIGVIKDRKGVKIYHIDGYEKGNINDMIVDLETPIFR